MRPNYYKYLSIGKIISRTIIKATESGDGHLVFLSNTYDSKVVNDYKRKGLQAAIIHTKNSY